VAKGGGSPATGPFQPMTHLFRGGCLHIAGLVAFLIFRASQETLSFGLVQISTGDNAAEWREWPKYLAAPTS
jgi:hypothetical protein